MIQIRIQNGNNSRLRALLGDLAAHVEVKRGDAILACDTEEQLLVGRAIFEKLLTTGGYTAFSVQEGTGESEMVKELDQATYPLIVIMGPIAGG